MTSFRRLGRRNCVINEVDGLLRDPQRDAPLAKSGDERRVLDGAQPERGFGNIARDQILFDAGENGFMDGHTHRLGGINPYCQDAIMAGTDSSLYGYIQA